MTSEYSVIVKLGGYIGSNPEILSAFPALNMDNADISGVLSKSLPYGAKTGEFFLNKYKKYNLISYTFKVEQDADRDDLFSFSILISKRDKTEIYKPALKQLIEILNTKGLLTEEILLRHQKTIFEGINQEQNIQIENVPIEFSEIFKKIRKELIKETPNLKGSFF